MGRFADDPGLGWHLATGELIAKTGIIPLEDLFLSTRRPWICDQWLSDLIFFKFFSLGDWPFLYAVLTSLYLVTFFGILYFGIASLTGGALSVSLATLLGFKLGLLHFILRPVMMGFPLMALVVLWADELYPRRLRVALVGLVFFIWAQLHPSFVLGLLLLLLCSLGKAIDGVCGKNACGLRDAVRGLAVWVFCLGATMCNPQGVELHRSILKLGGSTYFMRLNSEWLPLSFGSAEGVLFLSTFGVIIVGTIMNWGSSRWRTYDLLSATTFGYLAISSVRILPFYAIVMAPILTRSLDSLTRLSWLISAPSIRLLVRPLSILNSREKKLFRGSIVLTAMVVALLSDALMREKLLFFSGPFGPSSTTYPYQGVAELVALSTGSSEPAIVITHPDWGGFVVQESMRRLTPTIDDRNGLLGEDEYRAFFDAIQTPEGLMAYARNKKARFLLLPTSLAVHADLMRDNQVRPIIQDSISIAYSLTPE